MRWGLSGLGAPSDPAVLSGRRGRGQSVHAGSAATRTGERSEFGGPRRSNPGPHRRIRVGGGNSTHLSKSSLLEASSPGSSGSWGLEPGAWSLEPGAWSLEPGVMKVPFAHSTPAEPPRGRPSQMADPSSPPQPTKQPPRPNRQAHDNADARDPLESRGHRGRTPRQSVARTATGSRVPRTPTAAVSSAVASAPVSSVGRLRWA
jgi:hypothetical protein